MPIRKPKNEEEIRANREYYRLWNLRHRKVGKRWARKNKAKRYESIRKWQENNREKVRANGAVNDAIRYGKLQKSPYCQICGLICNTEAHHYMGYAKEFRLVVIWVCRMDHKAIHRKPINGKGNDS